MRARCVYPGMTCSILANDARAEGCRRAQPAKYRFQPDIRLVSSTSANPCTSSTCFGSPGPIPTGEKVIEKDRQGHRNITNCCAGKLTGKRLFNCMIHPIG